jgi:hypothetical protein
MRSPAAAVVNIVAQSHADDAAAPSFAPAPALLAYFSVIAM